MKKTISILLTTIILLGILSACSNQSQEITADVSTDQVYAEDVFDSQEQPIDTQPTEQTQGQSASKTQTPSTTPTTGTQTPTTQPTTPSTQPTTPPATESTTLSTEGTTPETPTVDYEAYISMTAAQKQTFRDSFENIDAFFAWYNAAKKAYDEANPPTPIPPDGNIPLN